MLSISRPNLNYPAWLPPRFDPTHIAAVGMGQNYGASVVVSGAGGVDLLTGTPGAISGSPTLSIVAGLGPALVSTVNTDRIQFTGLSTATPAGATFANICMFSTLANDVNLSQISGFTVFNMWTSVNGINIYNSGYVQSTITPLINTPYFVICSLVGTGTVNFLVMNLLTGQVQTAVTTTGLPIVNSGLFYIGGTTSTISASMWAPSFMSLQQMLMWARDPWSFWYPTVSDSDVDELLVGSAIQPFVSYNQSLFMM